MAFANVPDHPPPDFEFETSWDDQACPSCGWDREDEAQDYTRSHEEGKLIAIEMAEGSPFRSMAGTQLMALYWKCPQCGTLFTTEEDLNLGGMA